MAPGVTIFSNHLHTTVLFLLGRSRMKKWHIAALVIIGLIVAGIAYAMYEKRNAWRRDPMWRHAKRQLLSEGTPETNSGVPGLGPKTEKQTNTIGTQTSDPFVASERREKRARADAWVDSTDWGFDDLGTYL